MQRRSRISHNKIWQTLPPSKKEIVLFLLHANVVNEEIWENDFMLKQAEIVLL